MERPNLARDPRFKTAALRVKYQEELFEIIQGWITSMPGDDAVIERLNRHRVPVAPVLSASEAINHPHLRERGTVRRAHDKIFGEYEVPGFPLRFSAFKALDLEAPLMGEHNEEILTRYLSYTPERIRELERDKVLFSARI